MADPFLSVGQAANDLGVSTRTVRRYCEKGRLAATKAEGDNGLFEWQIEPSSLRSLKADIAGRFNRSKKKGQPEVNTEVADATAAEVRGINQRLAEITQVMAGLMAGYAETQKLLPAAQAEAAEIRAEAARLARERDEAEGRAVALQAENEALREALSKRLPWWQRLLGGK